MDPAPSDGILTGSARNGLTERPPPRPGVVLPDPDAGPDVRRGSPPLGWHLKVVAALAVPHAGLSGPALGMFAFGHDWLGGFVLVAFFFPTLLLNLAGALDIPWGSPEPLLLVNSLLWSATVYGLFLAGRWARTRLTRRSGFG